MNNTRLQKTTASIVLIVYLNLAFPVVPLLAATTGPATPAAKIVLPDPVRTPATVHVNRSAPANVAPATQPTFSAQPTAQEIFRARVLVEPLVPTGATPTQEENSALAAAIQTYLADSKGDLSVFDQYLATHPDSTWAASIWLNLGLRRFKISEFTKAITSYETAWNLSKTATERQAKAVADRAIAELLQMHARLGHKEVLEAMFKELGARTFTGKSTELVAGAHQGLELMQEQPDAAYRCGPAALNSILSKKNGTIGFNTILLNSKSTSQGINLTEVQKLGQQVGLDLQMAKRAPGAAIVTPALVHWKLGHYAALFALKGDAYRVEDPTFGANMYASASTLDSESSGYFLVPAGQLPAGWTAVSSAEGAAVWGKGNTTSNDNDRTTPTDDKTDCPQDSHAMTVVNAHAMVVSLNLMDTPVGYTPPYGPSVYFTLTYNQREASQPSVQDFSNLGDQWIHNWQSYVDEVRVYHQIGSGNQIEFWWTTDSTVRVAGGGSEVYDTYISSDPSFDGPYTFPTQRYSHTRLSKADASRYVITYPDGSQQVYGRRTGPVNNYRYFMTAVTDPSGNSVTLGYDATDRLTSITDALGQVTTFSYELAADPLKITKVTDPFGRFARIDYDGSGRLQKITDVIGIQSIMGYSGTSDFISSLTTPYGTSNFAFGEGTTPGRDRWLEMTDPQGDTEHVESRGSWDQVPGDGPLPSGINTTPSFSTYRNTCYWDKKAWKEKPNDPTGARITHWLHNTLNVTSGLAENIKNPMEGAREWYNYEGQTSSAVEGSSASVTKVGRVLDDGSSQVYSYGYNSNGFKTNIIDPLGRATYLIYDTNQTDLLEIRQITGPSSSESLAKYMYDNAHHVLTATDAAGQATIYTYNSAGQLSTITNAKNELTSFFYDPTGDPAGSHLSGGGRDPAALGYLVAIDGPLSGSSDTITIAYDGYGRIRTVTDTEGYAVTRDYDALDRLTLSTFPDTTTRQVVYDKLDINYTKDRRGNITTLKHNPIRQLITSTDPLGRMTQYGWCLCGSLRLLIDPNGNQTTWTRDVQGRVTAKTFADNTTQNYRYEMNTSRLASITDAKLQTTTYSYYSDDQLNQITYTGGTVATPTVSCTYDSIYPRLVTMADGVGTSTYSYNPITTTPSLGAGQLSTIDGPLVNDTISYTYDELGRVLSRSINGTNNSVTVSYDALGRTIGLIDALGSFTYGYVNSTARLDHVLYPNGQRTNYSYFSNFGDQRLQLLQNLRPDTSNLSSFAYTYDAEGMIQTWSKQLDMDAALTSVFKYDLVDQLTAAATPTGPSAQKQFIYRYDKAANRISEQIDNAVSAATTNNLNQVTSLSATGPIRFEGLLNESGTVSVNGVPATVAADNSFKADVTLSPGSNTVVVIAKDPSNNTATKSYAVTVASGTGRTLAYDLNGNLTDNGAGQTYGWDAANRLISITQSSGATTFVYDGLGRRVQEKLNGELIKQWVWCDGAQPAEERDASNSVKKRFYAEGEQISGTNYYYTRDHLGSVREMTDANVAVRARYEYDPYGRADKVSGDLESDFGYTNFYRHQISGLDLTIYRAFDAGLGRWISRDSVGEMIPSGVNLYSYVNGNSINAFDPLGLLSSLDATVVDPDLLMEFGLSGKGISVGGSVLVTGALVQVAKSELNSKKESGKPCAKSGGAGAVPPKRPKAPPGFPDDFPDKDTENWSATFKSEGAARAFARTKLGPDPVEVEPGKLRSQDGKWQYRAKPGDVSDGHVHLEELDPSTGRVIQNIHLRWQPGTGR